MTPQRPRKTLRRSHMMRRSLPKKAHLRVAPKLTQEEVKRLRAGAKEDLRSIAEDVVLLIEEDLRKAGTEARRRVRGAGPDDQRASYSINLTLTVEQRTRIEATAQRDGRSLSGYAAKVIVEALAGY